MILECSIAFHHILPHSNILYSTVFCNVPTGSAMFRHISQYSATFHNIPQCYATFYHIEPWHLGTEYSYLLHYMLPRSQLIILSKVLQPRNYYKSDYLWGLIYWRACLILQAVPTRDFLMDTWKRKNSCNVYLSAYKYFFSVKVLYLTSYP